MEKVKLVIIYYSATGTNYQLAQWAQAAAKEAGADVKLLRIEETAPQSAIDGNAGWKAHIEKAKDVQAVSLDDLEWADAIIFSVPTRYGNVPAQFKAFFDTTGGLWFKGKLANKVVSAMSSAANPHGGQEATILALYTSLHHWGCIIAAPGYTDKVTFGAGGNPYGTTVTVGEDGKMKEDVKTAVEHQARRTVTVAEWIKKGKS